MLSIVFQIILFHATVTMNEALSIHLNWFLKRFQRIFLIEVKLRQIENSMHYYLVQFLAFWFIHQNYHLVLWLICRATFSITISKPFPVWKKRKEKSYVISVSTISTILILLTLFVILLAIKKKLACCCSKAKSVYLINRASYKPNRSRTPIIENETVPNNSAISFPDLDEINDDNKNWKWKIVMFEHNVIDEASLKIL